MSWVPGNRQNCNKRKSQAGNLAGTVAQNLWNRCHYLSRMSERKDVQNSTVTALSVQQSTGVILMSTVLNVKPMSPAFCEKNILLRRVFLLPKIVHSYPPRSSVAQSLLILAPVTGQYRYSRGNEALYLPDCRWKKQRSDDWNTIASDTRLSSSSVNPKLFSIRWIFSYSSVEQLRIDAYSNCSLR